MTSTDFFQTKMKSRLASLVVVGMLIACTGIPLRSLPRLLKFQYELLNANPAEFMVAIQVDARMTPPPGAAPVLHLTIRPSEAGAFEIIDRRLAMRVSAASANALGLAPAPVDRRWLIYSFPPESQADLLRIQNYFKTIRAQKQGGGGGSISVGIAQDGVASRDPALANTRWESWLQTSKQDGYFELWSGSIAELLKQAKSTDAGATP